MLKHHLKARDFPAPHPLDAQDALVGLVGLVAAVDAAEWSRVDLPLERPGLLEPFLDPEVQDALPAALRSAAETYLDGLPGYRSGDLKRAAEQHALRLALWRGEAQVVDEADLEALGLTEEIDDG